MANDEIDIYIMAREKNFICVKSADTVRCRVVLLKRRPGAVRCPSEHRPMLLYTYVGRRLYDL